MADEFDQAVSDLKKNAFIHFCEGGSVEGGSVEREVEVVTLTDAVAALRSARAQGFTEGIDASVAYVQKAAAEMVAQIKGTKNE